MFFSNYFLLVLVVALLSTTCLADIQHLNSIEDKQEKRGAIAALSDDELLRLFWGSDHDLNHKVGSCKLGMASVSSPAGKWWHGQNSSYVYISGKNKSFDVKGEIYKKNYFDGNNQSSYKQALQKTLIELRMLLVDGRCE